MNETTYLPWLIRGKVAITSTDFRPMTEKEAAQFAEEIGMRAGERLAALEGLIRSTPSFGRWRASGSRRSLIALGRWAHDYILTKPASSHRAHPVIMNKLPKGITVNDLPTWQPSWEFDRRAWPVLADIGIYLGVTLQQSSQQWKWARYPGGKGDALYNHPAVVYGKKQRPAFCAIAAAESRTARMLDGLEGPSAFADIVQAYREMVGGE